MVHYIYSNSFCSFCIVWIFIFFLFSFFISITSSLYNLFIFLKNSNLFFTLICILLLFLTLLILSPLYDFFLPCLFGIMQHCCCFSFLVEIFFLIFIPTDVFNAPNFYLNAVVQISCAFASFYLFEWTVFKDSPAPDINLPLFHHCAVCCLFIHFEHTLICWKQICLWLLYILDL